MIKITEGSYLDNKTSNTHHITISLEIAKELNNEDKVNLADLLVKLANSCLQNMYVVGIKEKDIKASEAFQTEISYREKIVEISFDPKNKFFSDEVNKINNIKDFIKVADLNFGFFIKIALKTFSTISPGLEDFVFTGFRKIARDKLVNMNLELISSTLHINFSEVLTKIYETPIQNKSTAIKLPR